MKIIGLLIGAFLLYQGVENLVRALFGEGQFDISGVTEGMRRP